MNQPNRLPHLLSLLLCLLLAAGCARQRALPDPKAPVPNVLRLHVIANSDSPADQAVKLQVRDAILSLMEPGDSLDAAKSFLLAHSALFQQTVEETLKAHGFSYGAELLLGVYPFPDRDYGGTVYPAGNYEALRVVLGEGKGQNWWCVLFPPLCILSEEAVQEDSDVLEFHSSILNWWRNLT